MQQGANLHVWCRDEIREATSSMTSVPKPLKFLRPHYDGMKEFFGEMMDSENKTAFSEVLSVLGMTMAGCDHCLPSLVMFSHLVYDALLLALRFCSDLY